ncbi:unnamed protein product [Adineta steineri]|uniref:NAD(P)(+)--arginine ADP-ribosyltransferase n=1 Tax=Adineta steineri TaxID=433720 RepID=A0A815JZR2_9BILA|nr:unnamed protein product [Adineta steineri]CAF4122762.1 unnamed protein product [Adineta steineri]
MSGLKSNENAAASFNIRRPRQRMTQNYLLLWVDTSIDQANDDYENTLKQIRTITGDVNVFTQRDACIDFLTDAQEDTKSFLVVKDSMFQEIMLLINDIPQLGGIYIYNDIKTLHEEWTKKWQKIKSVHSNIDDICQRLQLDIKQYHQDSIAISFITVNEMASTDNLNQLDPTFMYTQLFKEILLDMEHSKQAVKDFITYCRDHDCVAPKYIDRFEKEYDPQLAIWWYSLQSNIYHMLNYALRTLDADIIITMGFFLRDVHKQIQQLYKQQVSSYDGKSFEVYRGQGLMKSDFEKLQKTKGGLMSFNNFLSTSTDKGVSLGFAECASTIPDTVGVLFIMSIDPSIKSTPFASIKEMSAAEREEEILFSMHTVFRVGVIQQTDNRDQLYQVELQLTSDDDQQLRLLTNRIREEAGANTGWRRLGKLLLTTGKFNKAEELYNILSEKTSDENEKQYYYNQLGLAHWNQGNYEKAIWYYEQRLEFQQKTLPSNHFELATSYNNIGLVCGKMAEDSKALSYFKKALEIYQKTLPSDHSDLAISYNNIGTAYNSMGEYSKALSHYEKALQIRQKALPSNHPDLAISYNNIGNVYHKMGEYSKELLFYEKALEIQQKTLPANHPHLAQSYNNIGNVYHEMGEHSKELSFFEKALEIRQKTLPSSHPDIAQTYSSIGSAYHSMEEYSKALSFYEKALPSNHPDLAISYNNIGNVYHKMREYSKALSFLEKALEIQQKTLPSNHPDFAPSYNNIGSVYVNMGEYSKALSFYEKVLEIYEKPLTSNHPHLASSYNNIGRVYHEMGEHSKELSFYEKALKIRQKTLPLNHHSFATSYNNIGMVYQKMGEHSKALSFFEKALEIKQKNLLSNHPPFATLYKNIGFAYENIKDYSKALSFYEQALEIEEKTLLPNHPSLAILYNNIGFVYENMKDYLKALSYYERAQNIRQRTLPLNHPSIKNVKESTETVKEEVRKNS